MICERDLHNNSIEGPLREWTNLTKITHLLVSSFGVQHFLTRKEEIWRKTPWMGWFCSGLLLFLNSRTCGFAPHLLDSPNILIEILQITISTAFFRSGDLYLSSPTCEWTSPLPKERILSPLDPLSEIWGITISMEPFVISVIWRGYPHCEFSSLNICYWYKAEFWKRTPISLDNFLSGVAWLT